MITLYSNDDVGNNSNRIINPKQIAAKALAFELELNKSTIIRNIGTDDQKYISDIYEMAATNIHGIMEEQANFSYSTSLKDAPNTSIPNFFKDFVNNPWVKMAAETSHDYRPIIATDGWTQQFPNTAEYTKFSIEFKAYPVNDYFNTTSYFKILNFLLLCTSPAQFHPSNSIKLIQNAVTSTYVKGMDFADLTNKFYDSVTEDITLSDLISAYTKKYIQYDDGTYSDIGNIQDKQLDIFKSGKVNEAVDILHDIIMSIQQMSKKGSNETVRSGCPTCFIKRLGTLISPSSRLRTIDFFIADWTMTPSMEVTHVIDPITKLHYVVPVSVTFKIGLESTDVLTSDEIYGG